jgi:hypothetical protein
MAQLVGALRYKPEGPRFTAFFRLHYDPCVGSATNRTTDIFGRGRGGKGEPCVGQQPCHLHVPIVNKF